MVLKGILAIAGPQKRQAGSRTKADRVGQSVWGTMKIESIEAIKKYRRDPSLVFHVQS